VLARHREPCHPRSSTRRVPQDTCRRRAVQFRRHRADSRTRRRLVESGARRVPRVDGRATAEPPKAPRRRSLRARGRRTSRISSRSSARWARTTPRCHWVHGVAGERRGAPSIVQLAAISASPKSMCASSLNGLGLATDANALHGRLSRARADAARRADALATRQGIAMRASGLTTRSPACTAMGRCASLGGCQRPWTLAYVTANAMSYHAVSHHGGEGLQRTDPGTPSPSLEGIWDGDRYQRFRTDSRATRSRPVPRLRAL